MVIFLYGADTFSSKKKLEEIKKKFLGKKSNINLESQEADDLNKNSLHALLFTQGFAKKKLIILKGLLLGKQKANHNKESLYQEIIQFIKKDNPNILVIQEGEIPLKSLTASGKKLYLLLEKKALCQKFDLPKKYQIKQFIQKELQKRGIDISPSSLDIIGQEAEDLWQAKNQIDKITAWVFSQSKNYITQEDISNFHFDNLNEKEIFTFIDALIAGQKEQALNIITRILRQGESIDKIIFTLAKQFQTIFQIKKMLEKTKNPSYLSSKLKLHPYYLSKMIKYSSFYTFEQLKKIYHQFLLIDLERKTSQTNPELLLDLLVYKFI